MRNLKIKILFIIGIILILIILFIVISFFSNSIQEQNDTIPMNPTVTLSPEEKEMYESFIPRGEEGMTEENSLEYMQQREAANRAFAERKERLPFLMSLPYDGGTFKIEISPYTDTVFISTIPPESNKETYRQQALDWLETNGANFDNFEIEYKN